MTAFAIRISNSAKAVLLAASCALAAPSLAQVQEEEPDVEDVARTPLQDLNIDREDVPPVLFDAVQDPYASAGLDSCNDIVAEIAKLDEALGPDYDLAGAEDTGLSKGGVAKSVVGSFIPFRGLVREVSGAAGDARKAQAAAVAGMTRRGFLKGIGQQRGCAYPARPRADRPMPDPDE